MAAVNESMAKYSDFMCFTEFKVEPHHIFGFHQGVKNSLLYLDDHTIVFPGGNHLVLHHILQDSNRFIPVAKESQGIKAMAISPDRRYLAVSECRTQGTITIYDLQNQQCIKRQVITSGTIMVKEFACMAFSSDSKYLVGYSGQTEWGLYYWEWQKNRVVTKEKTTMLGLATQVSFSPKDNTQVCVSGNQMFKIFRLKDKSLKQINFTKMEQGNILCHAWMSEHQIIAGTDSGNLLLLFLKFSCVRKLERPADGVAVLQRITAITQYSRGFACSAGPALVCLYEKTRENDNYRKAVEIRIPPDPCLQPGVAESQEITSMCVSPAEETLAISTDRGQMYQVNLALCDINKRNQDSFEFMFHSFHSGSITGLSVSLTKPLVATCSEDNSVRIWNYKTKSLELYKEFPKEPNCVALHPNGLSILVGFFNKICLMNLLVDEFRIVGEITMLSCSECVFNHDGNMFAAISSNIIHVYNSRLHKKLELRGHLEQILSVKWSRNDLCLVSCGMDGAICVWNTLTGTCESEHVKTSCIYTDVTFAPNNVNVLAVSSDYRLQEFRYGQYLGEMLSDGVMYTAISMTHSGHAVMVGTSVGTVRVMQYPLQDEKHWTEYQAHSGPITKMVITPSDHYLLTASGDGSLLIWTITDHMGHRLCVWKEIDCNEEVLCAKTYLEKKNKSLQEAQTQLKLLKLEKDIQLNQKDIKYNKKLDTIIYDYIKQIETLKSQNKALSTENEEMKALHQETLTEMTKQHAFELESEKRKHDEMLLEAYKRRSELEKKMKELQQDREDELHQKESHYHAIENMKQFYEAKLQEQKANFQKMKYVHKSDDEPDLKHLCCKYEQDLQQVKEKNRSLEQEVDLVEQQKLMQLVRLRKELLDRDRSIIRLKEDLKRKQDHHKNSQSQLKELTMRNEEQQKTICSQKSQISSLHAKLERVEKTSDSDVLQRRVKQLRQERDHLKKNIQLKEVEQMHKKIENYKTIINELKDERLRNDRMNKEITEDLKKRLTLKDQELCHERQRVRSMSTLVEKMKADIQMGSSFLQQPKMMKDYFVKLHKRYQ